MLECPYLVDLSSWLSITLDGAAATGLPRGPSAQHRVLLELWAKAPACLVPAAPGPSPSVALPHALMVERPGPAAGPAQP